MAICMYANGLPFEPIEGRQVVNPSYKAKGNSRALLHSGIDHLAQLPKDVLILLFQNLELNELACMSVSCKKFNTLVANSGIWQSIANKIGCLVSKNEPAYVQVVGFIQRFVSECKKWKDDSKNLRFRGLGQQVDAKLNEFLFSKKMSFELLRTVNVYEEARNTAAISDYLIKNNDPHTRIGMYAIFSFARQADLLAQADGLKNSLFSTDKHRLEKLQVLDLSGYKVPPVLLDEILKIANLTVIKLKRCELAYFPQNLLLSKNLKTLHLAKNSIKEIPGSIISLQNLENLNLNGNELQTLPNTSGYLPKLASLDISNNHFQALPSDLLQLAPQLQLLSISNNPMKITSREMKVLHSAKQVKAEGLPRQSSIYLRYQILEDIKRIAIYSLFVLFESLELSLRVVASVFTIVEWSLLGTIKIIKASLYSLLITMVFLAKVLNIAVPFSAGLFILWLTRRIDARN